MLEKVHKPLFMGEKILLEKIFDNQGGYSYQYWGHTKNFSSQTLKTKSLHFTGIYVSHQET